MRHPRTLLAVLSLSLASCAVTRGVAIEQIAGEINATLSTSPFVLAPGDALAVAFPDKVEWNHESTVRPDGMASFLALDDVMVAGKTLEQADDLLTKAYASRYSVTDLTLDVVSFGGRSIVVMGEVQSPGAQPLDGSRVTLLDAIGRAGGPDISTSLLKNTVLIRWMAEEDRRRVWIIDARPRHWDSPTAILLQPYDIIHVPERPIIDVNIWLNNYIRRMIPFPQIFTTG